VPRQQRGREHADQAATRDEDWSLVLGHGGHILPAQGGLKTALYGPGFRDGMNSRRLNFQPASVFA
jgi:hypothetical protein